jgi:hypothetical protein
LLIGVRGLFVRLFVGAHGNYCTAIPRGVVLLR